MASFDENIVRDDEIDTSPSLGDRVKNVLCSVSVSVPDPHLNGNPFLHRGDTFYNPVQEVRVLLGHPNDRRGVELEVRDVPGDVRPLLGLIHKQVVDATDKGLFIPTRLRYETWADGHLHGHGRFLSVE